MSRGCSIPIAKRRIGEAEAQEGPMTVWIYVDISKHVGDPGQGVAFEYEVLE